MRVAFIAGRHLNEGGVYWREAEGCVRSPQGLGRELARCGHQLRGR